MLNSPRPAPRKRFINQRPSVGAVPQGPAVITLRHQKPTPLRARLAVKAGVLAARLIAEQHGLAGFEGASPPRHRLKGARKAYGVAFGGHEFGQNRRTAKCGQHRGQISYAHAGIARFQPHQHAF